MQYNTAGSVVKTTDASGHQTQFSYADQFAVNGTTLDAPLSFTTLAYPTEVTDPDGFKVKTRYRYDFGAATWKQTPPPPMTHSDACKRSRVSSIAPTPNMSMARTTSRPLPLLIVLRTRR